MFRDTRILIKLIWMFGIKKIAIAAREAYRRDSKKEIESIDETTSSTIPGKKYDIHYRSTE